MILLYQRCVMIAMSACLSLCWQSNCLPRVAFSNGSAQPSMMAKEESVCIKY